MIKVRKVGRVALGAKDLSAQTAFYTDLWGLGLTEEADGKVYLRTTAAEHHAVTLVPADAADWTRHPLSGEIVGDEDGQVWGRGAVDMKNMVAMMLAVTRQRMREQRMPPRDIVLAFPADEEAGGTLGAEIAFDRRQAIESFIEIRAFG